MKTLTVEVVQGVVDGAMIRLRLPSIAPKHCPMYVQNYPQQFEHLHRHNYSCTWMTGCSLSLPRLHGRLHRWLTNKWTIDLYSTFVPNLHKVIASISSTNSGVWTTCLRWRLDTTQLWASTVSSIRFSWNWITLSTHLEALAGSSSNISLFSPSPRPEKAEPNLANPQ